jgi:hypothetical protein
MPHSPLAQATLPDDQQPQNDVPTRLATEGAPPEIVASIAAATEGDPEFAAAVASAIGPKRGAPLPEENPAAKPSTPEAPMAPTSVWVLACERPRLVGGDGAELAPRLAYYYCAEGWLDAPHLAVPFSSEEIAAIALQGLDQMQVGLLEQMLGAVAQPTERRSQRPAKPAKPRAPAKRS